MAFLFSMRSVPLAKVHRRDWSAGTLPAIAEDSDDLFSSVSSRSQGPAGAMRSYDDRHKFNGSWSEFDRSPSLEKPTIPSRKLFLGEFRAKRGGWKRVAFILLLALLCIVGLVVGLVLGLRRHNSNTDTGTPNSSTSSTQPSAASFPVGSYSVDTYLETVNTNCTSDAATWRCYPYSTYAQSPASSAATFDWIIQPESLGSQQYLISSTNNPFSLVFTNASLTLLDADLSTERYTFQINMNKPVVPGAALTESNTATTCYFNQTTFEGTLYTHMTKTYGQNSSSNNTGDSFIPWPYAASVTQSANAGSNVPECFDTKGAQIGNFTVQAAQTGGQTCDCMYMNFG